MPPEVKHSAIPLHHEFSKKEEHFVRSFTPIVRLSSSYIVVGVRFTILVYSLDGDLSLALKGHNSRILDMATWKDILVSSSLDNTVRIWDLTTGQCIHIFSPWTVSRLCITELEQESEQNTMGLTEGNLAGIPVVIMYDELDNQGRKLKIRNLLHPMSQGIDTASTTPTRLASEKSLSHDIQTYGQEIWCTAARGNLVVAGGADFSVCVWDMINGQCQWVFIGHEGQVWSIDLDQKQVYSASFDNTIRIWNIETGDCSYILRSTSSVATVRVSLSHLVTCQSNGMLSIWNTTTGMLLYEIPESLFRTQYFQHDGRKLLFGGSTDEFLTVWDIASNKPIQSLLLGNATVNQHTFFSGRFCISTVTRQERYSIEIWEFPDDDWSRTEKKFDSKLEYQGRDEEKVS